MKEENKEYRFSKEMDEIFQEMCKRVGAPVEVVDSSLYWFNEYEWTEEEQEDFKKWLIGYLKKHRKGFGLEGATDSRVEHTANLYILNFGWKLKRGGK